MDFRLKKELVRSNCFTKEGNICFAFALKSPCNRLWHLCCPIFVKLLYIWKTETYIFALWYTLVYNNVSFIILSKAHVIFYTHHINC